MRRLRRAGLLGLLGLLSLLLGGCASLQPLPQDAAGREALLQQVWRLIDERHVDPAPAGWPDAATTHREAVLAQPVDDPEDLFVALDRVAGERRDAHTRVEGPREVARKTRDRGPSLGLGLVRIAGQWWSERPRADGAAAAAGLRAGWRLLRWNGHDAEQVWAERLAATRLSSTERARELSALRHWLDGPAGSRVQTEWEDEQGQLRRLELVRAELHTPPQLQFERRPSGVALLRWNRFDTRSEPELRRHLQNLGPDTPLLLDLRGNGGGSFDMTKRLLDLLLPQRSLVQITHLRDGRSREEHRVGGSLGAYGGPLRVLIDRASGSGAEMLAGALQTLGRARVLGETSCGCLLAIRRYAELPGGARLAVSEQALLLPDGRRIEGRGVEPDRPLARSVEALRAGRDDWLAAAEAELQAEQQTRAP